MSRRNRSLTLFVVSAAILFDALDLSITQIGLPSIQSDLDLGAGSLPWVANAYVLTYGGLLLLGGRAADLIGRRAVFVAGLVIFAAMSLVCGLAPDAAVLIGARAVQGIGALVKVPAVLGVALLALRVVDPGRAARKATRSYDLAGATASAAGLLLLVFVIAQVAQRTVPIAVLLVAAILAVSLLAGFVLWERRAVEPLMPLDFFEQRVPRAADLASLTVLAAPFGFSFLVTLFLQAGAGRALAAAGEAVDAARTASAEGGLSVRVDISSGGIETGALVVRRLRSERPDVAVHEVEVGVARGLELVRVDRLDVVLGRATPVPEELRTEPIRRELMLVGMAADHPLAAHAEVPVAALAGVDLLLPSDAAGGEWNEFVADHLSRSGVPMRRFPGATHGSVAAAEVMRAGLCVVPTMAWADPPSGIVFRRVVDPPALFTWAMLWRAGAAERPGVAALLEAARGAARERDWLAPAPQ